MSPFHSKAPPEGYDSKNSRKIESIFPHFRDAPGGGAGHAHLQSDQTFSDHETHDGPEGGEGGRKGIRGRRRELGWERGRGRTERNVRKMCRIRGEGVEKGWGIG